MNTRISPIVRHMALSSDCGERDGCVTAAIYQADRGREYEAVRERAALCDQNHFSKIRFTGEAAFDCLNHLILTDLARLPVDQAQQTFVLNEDGTPLADAFVLNEGDTYLLIAEGIERAELLARIDEVSGTYEGVDVTDVSEQLAAISIEGPYSWEVLKSFLGVAVIGIRYMEVSPNQNFGGIETTICRIGRTGEFGYFLFCDAARCAELWEMLRTAGEPFRIEPVGYQVIDICRVENRIPNKRFEGSQVGSVLELNACVMVGRDKENFSGREKIMAVLQSGPVQRVIGVSFPGMTDGTHPQVGTAVSCGGMAVGKLVNAVYSGVKGHSIGLALVDAGYAYVGLDYDVDGAMARSVSAPFIFNKSLQVRPQEDSFLVR